MNSYSFLKDKAGKKGEHEKLEKREKETLTRCRIVDTIVKTKCGSVSLAALIRLGGGGVGRNAQDQGDTLSAPIR